MWGTVYWYIHPNEMPDEHVCIVLTEINRCGEATMKD